MHRVKIACVRCVRTEDLFGLRLEEVQPRVWEATWAFAIRPEAASRERYDRSVLEGEFRLAYDYPGCPTCPNRSFTVCGSCQRLGCCAPQARQYRCPWCRREDEMAGGRLERLDASSDL